MNKKTKSSKEIKQKSSSPIVSSVHLATEEGWELSEFEYGLIVAFNAFSRWMTRCMGAVGYQDFNPLDILVLHNVNHRDKEKRLVDVAFVLNVEDLHTINYSLKKLMKASLVKSEKRGKEMFYSTTTEGQNICNEYKKVRDLCLVEPAHATEQDLSDLSRIGKVLRGTSGLYDQASRAAASL
ncbi:MAG: winged helix DNA-binding protein [Candidatus Sedimenticola sp. 6PFRAG7]